MYLGHRRDVAGRQLVHTRADVAPKTRTVGQGTGRSWSWYVSVRRGGNVGQPPREIELGVKPTDVSTVQYPNAGPAGTPEVLKSFVTAAGLAVAERISRERCLSSCRRRP